jgi:hypothetical protein
MQLVVLNERPTGQVRDLLLQRLVDGFETDRNQRLNQLGPAIQIQRRLVRTSIPAARLNIPLASRSHSNDTSHATAPWLVVRYTPITMGPIA